MELEKEKLFPSFHDKFETEIGLNDAPAKVPLCEKTDSVGFISVRQMSQVRRLHSFLVENAVSAPWIQREPEECEMDVIEPLKERFVFFWGFFSEVGE